MNFFLVKSDVYRTLKSDFDNKVFLFYSFMPFLLTSFYMRIFSQVFFTTSCDQDICHFINYICTGRIIKVHFMK